MIDIIKKWINPEKNAELLSIADIESPNLPVLWLLGKTGSGKSSLIQSLTHLTTVEIGNGFAPCAPSSLAYDFPQRKPILRFLDTRGLGEASYDPMEDIELCSEQGHVLMIVAKIDEPEQSSVVNALKNIRKIKNFKHLLIIHTAVNHYSEGDKRRMVAYNQTQFEAAWDQGNIQSIEVDFDCDSHEYFHRNELIDLLSEMLPIVGLMLKNQEYASVEEENFNKLQNEILWYAGVASASDLAPVVGLVSVPMIQAKMFHSLANQYGLEWDKRMLAKFIGALGTGISVQHGIKLGVRQLVKIIPVYGQTVGAVSAAAMSFGTTYGLGRAACFYFHHKANNEMFDETEIQELYKKAFDQGKKVRNDD